MFCLYLKVNNHILCHQTAIKLIMNKRTNKLSLNEKFIQKLKDTIEVNLSDNLFGVSELANEVGLSRSQLHRRLKKIEGKSSSKFISEYRLSRAMEMLKEKRATASEISYHVGFTSPSYFSTCFNEFYGHPPGETKFRETEVKIAVPRKDHKKIAKFLIVPALLLLLISLYFGFYSKTKVDVTHLEKSIAVMPFTNESPDENNLYFCNGIMAGIRDQLAKVPEFTVISRVSAEHYKDSALSSKQIADALGVNYLVEGRVQRIGEKAIISAELIYAANNKLLWSAHFDENVSDIFEVQTTVIESISQHLKTILSPEIKYELEKIPTTDQIAYDHYLMGEEYRFKAQRPNQKTEVWLDYLNKASLSYELAIKRDSLFARAYLGLAKSIYERNITYVQEEKNLKEVLELVNKTIELDLNYADAYILRGKYYNSFKKEDLAKKDFEKAYKLDPNNPSALLNQSVIYRRNNEFKKAISSLKKMEKIAESKEHLITVYVEYAHYYSLLRQHDVENFYLNKIANLYPSFFNPQFGVYIRNKRPDLALEYAYDKCREDNQERNAVLAKAYVQMSDNTKALEYFSKWYEQISKEGINSFWGFTAYNHYGICLIKDGQVGKGKEMLQKQVDFFNILLQGKRSVFTPQIYYEFFILYATLGEFDKAYENLKKFEETEEGWSLYGDFVSWAKVDTRLNLLHTDPVFMASIERGEMKIQAIQNEILPYLTTKLLD